MHKESKSWFEISDLPLTRENVTAHYASQLDGHVSCAKSYQKPGQNGSGDGVAGDFLMKKIVFGGKARMREFYNNPSPKSGTEVTDDDYLSDWSFEVGVGDIVAIDVPYWDEVIGDERFEFFTMVAFLKS